jgi:hypothetical protein
MSGGLGFNATQVARMAEITTLDVSIYVTLGAHQSIGTKSKLILLTLFYLIGHMYTSIHCIGVTWVEVPSSYRIC